MRNHPHTFQPEPKQSERLGSAERNEILDIDGDGTVSWCERLLVMILAGLLGIKLL